MSVWVNHLFKLLNVGIFALTGVFGVVFLQLGMTHVHRDDGVALRAAAVPPLSAAGVGTANCNTFRPWEDEWVQLRLSCTSISPIFQPRITRIFTNSAPIFVPIRAI